MVITASNFQTTVFTITQLTDSMRVAAATTPADLIERITQKYQDPYLTDATEEILMMWNLGTALRTIAESTAKCGLLFWPLTIPIQKNNQDGKSAVRMKIGHTSIYIAYADNQTVWRVRRSHALQSVMSKTRGALTFQEALNDVLKDAVSEDEIQAQLRRDSNWLSLSRQPTA